MSASARINLSAEAYPVLRNESEFRRYVIEQIKDNEIAHVTYIESHLTSAGVPDLNIYMLGRDIWLELKVMTSLKGPKMRSSQKRWHIHRWNQGGKSWVLTLDMTNMELLVVPGHVGAGLGTSPSIWRRECTVHPISGLVNVIRSMTRRL